MAQIQLLARGIQDAWLSGEPQVSFYRSNMKRHTPFGLAIEQFTVPVDGKIVINTKSDLLGYTYLMAYDKTTGALVPNPVWMNIISSVELVIGNQTIAIHDLTYINTIQKVLESDTYSKRSQTPAFQPLGFFFDRQALPLVALKYTEVKINITWNSTIVATQYIYKCWSHCIRLGEDERRFFATQRHQILIPQIQRVPISREPFFSGPLKYIAAPCVNYTAVYGSWVTKFTNTTVGNTGHTVYAGDSYLSMSYTTGPLELYNSDGSIFPTSLASIGTSDSAVTRIDAGGNIVWCASMGAPGKVVSINDIKADASGLYITGIFAGTVTFNNSNGNLGATLTEFVVGTSGEGFLVKYDLDGNVLWCTKWGMNSSTNALRAWSVEIDSTGVYVSGRNTGSVSIRFYSSDDTFSAANNTVGSVCSYIVKYDTNGIFAWRSVQRATPSSGLENYGLAVDSTQVYISAGTNVSTLTFFNSDVVGAAVDITSSNCLQITMTGTQNSYIGAYNLTTGNIVWRARIGSPSGAVAAGFIRDAAADSSGLYVGGNGVGTIYLYDLNDVQSSISVTGTTTYGLIACYGSNGIPKWAAKIANVSRINCLAVYNGFVYATGFLSETLPAIFYSADGTQYPYTLTRKGTLDAYVVAYTTDGVVQWIIQGASTNTSTNGRFNVDENGVYLPGSFNGTNLMLYNQTGNTILNPLLLTGTQTGYLYKFNPW
jgi:hypothetical protein